MITKLNDFKLLKESYQDELKFIGLIKKYLLEQNDYDTWEEFIDSQEMGDCQGIVADIINEYSDLANTFGHKLVKCFGHIKIDEPVWVESMNDYNDLFTHHWVKFNDNILDFSKGTLKDYIQLVMVWMMINMKNYKNKNINKMITTLNTFKITLNINESIKTLQQDAHDKLKITLDEDIILNAAKAMFKNKVKVYSDISKLGTVDYDNLIKKLYDNHKKVNENNATEEVHYIEFLNKDKKFQKDKIEFPGENGFQDAIKWGRENLEKFSVEMIQIK